MNKVNETILLPKTAKRTNKGLKQPAKSIHQAWWCNSRKDRSQKWKVTHTITTTVYMHDKAKPRERDLETRPNHQWLGPTEHKPPIWIHCSPHMYWDELRARQELIHPNTINTGWWRPLGRVLKHVQTLSWRSLMLHPKPPMLTSTLVEGTWAHIYFRQIFLLKM